MLVFRVLGRLLGRFFGGIGHIFAALFRFLRRHEMAIGVVVVFGLVIGGIYLLLSALSINIVLGQPQASTAAAVVTATPVPATPTPAPTATPAISRTNAPAATEAYLRGQATYDANLVWDSLGAELHAALQGRGQDKAAFERTLQDEKSKGIQFEGYQYIGGYSISDGSSLHFYVIKVRDSENKVQEQPITFRLGQDGKIIGLVGGLS